mmetsp:Transcript_25921/g.74157  ORF Transcript_25921/g.74157 Transcript_25921/m.74157 type:complete len:199 (+) Transcript_25921:107-703(+)
MAVVVGSEGKNASGADQWKVPFWQEPVRQVEMALHPDGPIMYAKREAYLQKRAGNSRIRWNVRFFELKEGQLRWWRPAFKDQLLQPKAPRVSLKEPRPAPNRCLDLTKLKGVVRTKVKFPYSTRILLQFDETYNNYKLELRAEREIEIIEWYKLFCRFTIEVLETEVETEAGTEGAGTADDDEDSDSEQAPAEQDGRQ